VRAHLGEGAPDIGSAEAEGRDRRGREAAGQAVHPHEHHGESDAAEQVDEIVVRPLQVVTAVQECVVEGGGPLVDALKFLGERLRFLVRGGEPLAVGLLLLEHRLQEHARRLEVSGRVGRRAGRKGHRPG